MGFRFGAANQHTAGLGAIIRITDILNLPFDELAHSGDELVMKRKKITGKNVDCFIPLLTI